METKHTPELLGYREIVEKNGIGLDDIFYVRSFVRLWQCGNIYQVTACQSGNGRDYYNEVFKSVDEAQKAYDTVQGVLAIAKAEGV